MIDTTEDLSVFLAVFESSKAELAAAPAWLRVFREGAMARFGELGLPTTRQENWRYTNVAPIGRTPFVRGSKRGKTVSRADIEPFLLGDAPAHLLVFVDGHFDSSLSRIGELPAGTRIESISSVLRSSAELVEYWVARKTATASSEPFLELNNAFLEDGAWVSIGAGTLLDRPVHLLFVATGSEAEPVASHPRSLVRLGAGARAQLIESYVSLDSGVSFANAVTEILLDRATVLEHNRLGRESAQAFHVGAVRVHQDRDSRYVSNAVSLGGRIVRNDIAAVLGGEGASCVLNGLYLVDGTRHVDYHTAIDHARPHGTSVQLYKGILDGEATAVFNGQVLVRKDAQKTDSRQSNRNLLLSENATVDTKPQLEILADDVKCSHGATIGQLEETAIFYLRSRGIGEQAAKELLTYAFASEVVRSIGVESVRRELDSILLRRLPIDLRLAEAM